MIAWPCHWALSRPNTITGFSGFFRALFQFSKRAAGEAAKFGRSRVELLGMVGAARLECSEPAAETGELLRRQLGNGFGDFFDFHVAEYTTAETWLRDGQELGLPAPGFRPGQLSKWS